MPGTDPPLPLRANRSRLNHCSLGRAWCGWALGLACVVLVLAILERVLVLGLDGLVTPWPALALPLLALVAAAWTRRKVGSRQAARAADEHVGSADLFLTWDALHGAPADAGAQAFAPVVAEDAHHAAAKLRPERVVPYRFSPKATRAVGAMGALLRVVLFLPEWDLLDRRAEERQVAETREELTQQKDSLKKRKDRLKAMSVTEPNSPMVQQALDNAEDLLRSLPERTQEQVRKDLRDQQKDLDAQWQRATERADSLGGKAQREWQRAGREQARQSAKGRDGESGAQATSRSGSPGDDAADLAKAGRKAAEELSDKVAEELERLRQEAAALKQEADAQVAAEERGEAAPDAAAAEKQAQQLAALQRALQNLAQQAGADSGLGRTLREAAELAQKAGQCAGDSQSMQKALEALMEALENGQLESSALAQAMRDLQALQDAMSACQGAGQCNGAGSLQALAKQGGAGQPGSGQSGSGEGQGDGAGRTPGDGMPGKGSAMQDYKAFYQALAQRMAGTSNGGGPGMGPNGGTGSGGKAPTDARAAAAFQQRKSRTDLQAGRMLLDMQKERAATDGEAKARFESAVRTVQQGVGEASTTEEVPAGYHAAIRNYFDNLPGAKGKPTQGSGSTGSCSPPGR